MGAMVDHTTKGQGSPAFVWRLTMLRGANKSAAVYNAKVLDWLRQNAPAHAEELNAHGTARGWWDQVNYFRVMYKTVAECGRSISLNQLENKS